jgi:hypothetical protein
MTEDVNDDPDIDKFGTVRMTVNQAYMKPDQVEVIEKAVIPALRLANQILGGVRLAIDPIGAL